MLSFLSGALLAVAAALAIQMTAPRPIAPKPVKCSIVKPAKPSKPARSTAQRQLDHLVAQAAR